MGPSPLSRRLHAAALDGYSREHGADLETMQARMTQEPSGLESYPLCPLMAGWQQKGCGMYLPSHAAADHHGLAPRSWGDAAGRVNILYCPNPTISCCRPSHRKTSSKCTETLAPCARSVDGLRGDKLGPWSNMLWGAVCGCVGGKASGAPGQHGVP